MTTIAFLLGAWTVLLPLALLAWTLLAARTDERRKAVQGHGRPLDLSISLD